MPWPLSLSLSLCPSLSFSVSFHYTTWCLKSRKSDCYLPYSAVKPFAFCWWKVGMEKKEQMKELTKERARVRMDVRLPRGKKNAKKGEEKICNRKLSRAWSICLFFRGNVPTLCLVRHIFTYMRLIYFLLHMAKALQHK